MAAVLGKRRLVAVLAATVSVPVMYLFASGDARVAKRPCRRITDPTLGARYVAGALCAPHPSTCRTRFGMNAEAFRRLVDLLSPYMQGVRASRVSVLEEVGIFLDWVTTCRSLMKQADAFQHSPDTIFRSRQRVTSAIDAGLYPLVVKQPTAVPRIKDGNAKYEPFTGAVGYIDGTHIPVWAPRAEKERWRSYKHGVSQNVLVIVDEAMLFTFVAPGAEGAGHDSTIYGMVKHRLRLPERGFLVGTPVHGQ